MNPILKQTPLSAACLALSVATVAAYEHSFDPAMVEAMDSRFSMDVSLNSDTFFGFYPLITGAYEINETFDFTFYGLIWAAGTGGNWGNWTEFGIGLNYKAFEGLDINPQIGVLGGNLLSSGTAGDSVLGDGIVPNLTVNYDLNRIEGEFYLGYYAPIRDRAPVGGTTLSYLHYWVNAGYQFHPFFSMGAHFEQLVNTGGSNVANSSTVYTWVGPYLQFSKPSGGFFARFTFGADIERSGDTFYKVAAGYSF